MPPARRLRAIRHRRLTLRVDTGGEKQVMRNIIISPDYRNVTYGIMFFIARSVVEGRHCASDEETSHDTDDDIRL